MKKNTKIIIAIITVIGSSLVAYFQYLSPNKQKANTESQVIIKTDKVNKSIIIGKVDNNSKVEYVGGDKIDKSTHVSNVDKSVKVQTITNINTSKVFSDREKEEILNVLNERNKLLEQPDMKYIVLTPNSAFGGSSDLVKDLTLFLKKKGFIIIENDNSINDNSYNKRCFMKNMPKGSQNWLIISDI